MIYDAIVQFFNNRGYNVVVGSYYIQVEKWLSWYRGNVNDFHFYRVNGLDNKLVDKEKRTLGMAKQVCEDFAKLEFNEKSEVLVKNNDIANEYLQEVLKDNDFSTNFIKFLELSKALGNGYIVEYVDNEKIKLDFINGKKAVITSYNNKLVNGVVTITQKQVEEEENGKTKPVVYTHLQHHIFRDEEYYVEHYVFKSEKMDTLGKQINPANFLPVELLNALKYDEAQNKYVSETIKTPIPLFQKFSPNIVNNFDIDTPYGISIYANSIDTLKNIDNKYDAYDVEFTNGRSRLLLDSSLTEEYQETASGGINLVRKFDGDTEVFVSMPNMGGENDNRDKIFAFTPELREEKISQAISNELALLGFKTRLGKNKYEFKTGIVQTTATGVKAADNEKWMGIEADRKITEDGLIRMAKAILVLANELEHISVNVDELDIAVFFDDSVATDKQTELDNARNLVTDGIYSKKYLLTDILGFTEKEANKMIEDVRKEQEIENASIFGKNNMNEYEDEEEPAEDNPTPKPNESESKDEFIARFMSNDKMMAEYPSEEQRLAVANSVWSEYGNTTI